MSNFVIIFICFLLGILFKKIDRFPRSTSLSINLFVIYVSLPALILLKFPPLLKSLEFSGHWWLPISMSWMSFLMAWIFIFSLSKKLNWSRAKTGALILTCGLGNTSFVGFPILESILGKAAIPVGILADQPGSFLIVSSLGILVAAQFSGENANYKLIIKKVFTFPPFLAMLFAIGWTIIGTPGFLFFNEPLEKIASTLIPLALFAVGFQTDFHFKVIRRRSIPLVIGLLFKLIFLPIFFFVFYSKVLNINDFFMQVSVLEAAMATQITSAVVATDFNLDAELANLMVGLSIPLSLITVPIFNKILFG